MIFHITTSHDWEASKTADDFVPADFHREGFIHCCTAAQLPGVIERYFQGKSGLVLLTLDEPKLSAALKFEPATGGELFPHLYGGINRDAIVNVRYL